MYTQLLLVLNVFQMCLFICVLNSSVKEEMKQKSPFRTVVNTGM